MSDNSREWKDVIKQLAGTYNNDLAVGGFPAVVRAVWYKGVTNDPAFGQTAEQVQLGVGPSGQPNMSIDVQPIGGQLSTSGSGPQQALQGVQLNAESNDGVVTVPTIGSTVWISWTARNFPYVAQFSNIDQHIITSTATGQQLTVGGKNGLQINNGTYGGLLKNAAVVDNLNSAIEYTGALAQAITTAINAGGSPATILAAMGAGVTAVHSNPPSLEDMENPDATHGSSTP